MQQKKIEISAETVAESLRLARATQVAGQSKEQTQLIAQGIQKGLAEYKRAQKTKQRAADRAKKQQRRQSGNDQNQRQRQECRADQPAPGHWHPRPSGLRAFFTDRTAQCHGRS